MTTQAKQKLVEAFNKTICINDIIEDLVNAVAENLEPEDVFDIDRLAEWAEANGYKKN